MTDSMKNYIGKTVYYNKTEIAHIDEITGYCIVVQLEDGRCYRFDTGTGPYDNAVAKGYIKFVDEKLQQKFIEEYEEYIHSMCGSIEAFSYYAQMYD